MTNPVPPIEHDTLTEQNYRTLFNSSDQGLCICEILLDAAGKPVDYRFLEVNPTFERHTGLQDVIGKTALQLVPNLERHWIENYGKVALNNESLRFEEGSEAMGRWFDVYAFHFGQPDSRKFAIIFTNITNRKKAEKALAELTEASDKRKRLYETTLSNTPDLIYVFDLDHRFTYANESLLKMWGKSWKESIGKNCLELGYEPWHAAMHDREIDQVVATKKPIRGEVPFDGTNGRRIYDYIFTPVIGAHGEVEAVAGTTRDITDRKQGEETLRLRNAQFEALLNGAPLGVYLVDADFKLQQVNPTAQRVFGDIPDLIGRDFAELLYLMWPREDAEGFVKVFRHTLETGEPYTSPEYTEERVDRRVREFYQFQIVRIPLPDGRNGVVCYFHDISTQVLARFKVQETAANLERSNKELEQFAYIASHDLQEPLRMVTNYLQLLERACQGQLDEAAQKYITHAVNGALRMKTLIQDLLSYSQAGFQKTELHEVSVQAVLELALTALREAIVESGAKISQGAMPTINADETLLVELFQNLIGNAIKYRQSRTPEISVQAIQAGNDWLFSVRDNGIGIDPAFKDRIFGMFQRLHSRKEYSGTGIGLAICKKIVERHGGRIWVDSQPGQGSTFFFTLPAL